MDFGIGAQVLIQSNCCEGETATVLRHVLVGQGTFEEEHYVVRVNNTGRDLAFMPHELLPE